MAKSARASSKKVNHTKLRARVFAPVEKARAERLHAKLLATINQPKPEKTDMDTSEESTTADATKEDGLSKDMDVDGAAAAKSTKSSKSNKDKSQSRKQLRRKPQNKMSFPASRGKGALKPFTGGRVNKRR